MAQRLSAALVSAALIGALGLSGCANDATQSAQAPTAPAPAAESAAVERTKTEAEAELDRTSAAMQRTIMEAAGLGAAAGAGIGGSFGVRGLISGIMIGAAALAPAGTYVGLVQKDYETEESRLERISEDLDLSNAEAEAALSAMRVVLDEQRAEILAIKARIAGDKTAEAALDAELSTLRQNVSTMRKAITGAEQRRKDLGETRGIAVSEEASVEVLDPRLAALSRRITAMREVADTLAAEAS